MPTAILVDAGYFLKRFPSCYPKKDKHNAALVAKTLFEMCLSHLEDKTEPEGRRQLFRIFVYDCPPLSKKVHYPKSRRSLDFSKTAVSVFRLAFHEELKRMRKVALRWGHLADGGEWSLRDGVLKLLLAGELAFDSLTDEQFEYKPRQKGVDMRVGLDIASLAFKKQADQIVLIAGDADFVPAAKLARVEGIDFIIDPMWSPVSPHLHEHVDGLKSTCPRPNARLAVAGPVAPTSSK